MFSLESLIKAYLSCRRKKRATSNALSFEEGWERNLLLLQKKLNKRTYSPGSSICFVVTHPKTREVFASTFKDRVTHHLLVKRVEPFFEKRFIFDSYACRKEKGTHLAAQRIKKVLDKRRNKRVYCLQIDVKSFFAQINKKVLFSLLKGKIDKASEFKKDKQKILWLSRKIIFHDPTKNYYLKGKKELLDNLPPDKTLFKTPPGKGLPIGNLTSQFFANVYLNELDQFVKRKLKVQHYFRYADDMVLLHQDKNQLKKWRGKINDFLKARLDLELNHKKTSLEQISEGINFAGYIIKPDYTLCRKRTVKSLKTKLHYFNQGFLLTSSSQKEEVIPLSSPPSRGEVEKMRAVVNSYYGHFLHADTYKLRKSIYKNHLKKLKRYLKPVDDYKYFKITKK